MLAPGRWHKRVRGWFPSKRRRQTRPLYLVTAANRRHRGLVCCQTLTSGAAAAPLPAHGRFWALSETCHGYFSHFYDILAKQTKG